MSILNHTSDGLYSQVAVLYRALAHFGPMKAEDLVEWCTAGIETGKEGQPSVRHALARWQGLGLFAPAGGGLVGIADRCAPTGEGEDDLALTESLRRAVLKVVFLPKSVGTLLSTDGSADFARGLSWWMAQDAWSTDMSTNALLSLEGRQLSHGDIRLVNNNVRMDRLREWASFLGFVWTSGRVVQLDPTMAILRVLDAVLPPSGQPLAAADFVAALAEVLPVLDGGTFRLEVESKLKSEVWQPTPAGWVSSTLGRALRRLAHLGRLRLIARADAGTSMRVPGRGGAASRPWHAFTHVERAEFVK